jgi:hypothetical protein
MIIFKDLRVRECRHSFSQLEDMGAFLSDGDTVRNPVWRNVGEWIAVTVEFLVAVVVFTLSEEVLEPTATSFLLRLKFWDYKLLVVTRFC